jgi:hypothetical protein
MDKADHPHWFGGPDNLPYPASNGRHQNGAAVKARPVPPPSPTTASPATSIATVPAAPPATSLPTPVAPPASPVEHTAPETVLSSHEMAQLLGSAAGAMYTANMVGAVIPGMDNPEVMTHYLRGLTHDCNADPDPLQRMMVELSAMTFHQVGSMYCNSAHAKTPEAAVAYSAAACRLMSEFRKSVLAMKALQTVPMSAATFKKVVHTRPAIEPQNKFVTELGSKEAQPAESAAGEKHDGNKAPAARNGKESPPRRGRKKKSATSSGLDPRGAGEAAGRDSDKQAVAVVNGTAHKRW